MDTCNLLTFSIYSWLVFGQTPDPIVIWMCVYFSSLFCHLPAIFHQGCLAKMLESCSQIVSHTDVASEPET